MTIERAFLPFSLNYWQLVLAACNFRKFRKLNFQFLILQTIQKAKKYLKSSCTLIFTQTNPLLMSFLRHYILVKRVISENMQKMQKKKNEGEIESSQTE